MTKNGELCLLLVFLIIGANVLAMETQQVHSSEVKPQEFQVIPAQVIKPTDNKETPKKVEALEMAKAVSMGGLSLFFLYSSYIALTQGVKFFFNVHNLSDALKGASQCSSIAAALLGTSYFLGKQCRESLERLKVLKPGINGHKEY